WLRRAASATIRRPAFPPAPKTTIVATVTSLPESDRLQIRRSTKAHGARPCVFGRGGQIGRPVIGRSGDFLREWRFARCSPTHPPPYHDGRRRPCPTALRVNVHRPGGPADRSHRRRRH